MTILGLVFMAYNIAGTGFSIAGVINPAIKKYYKTTAEELFKKSFEKVVKQYASDFADITDPKKVEVDPDTFDNVIASLKDVDEIQFIQLNQSEKIAEITTLFRPCIIVPKRQFTDRDIDHRIRPIVERIIVDFFVQLPFEQDAFNQVVLEFLQKNTADQKITHSMLIEVTREIEQVQSEVSERLTQDIQTIKDYTEKIEYDHEKIKHTTGSNNIDTCLPLISNPELESKCRIGDFDSDLLLEIAKLSNWKLAEPYNSFVLALGRERMNLQTALDVSVDFLFTLWEESILFRHKEFLTLGILTGLTYGQNVHTVLNRLENLIQNKHRHFLPVENSILRRINEFKQIYPLEDNFTVLAEYDIRVKGTRVGIETILVEYIHNSRPPEAIADHYYYSLTVERVYATILYYLQNQENVGAYFDDYLKFCQTAREEQAKNLSPAVVRLRKLIAEKRAKSDIPEPTNPEKDAASTTQTLTDNERG